MTFPRRRVPEWMDDPALDPVQHRHALSGLRRINWWSRSASYVWTAIEEFVVREGLNQVSVLDLACGGGEVALQLVGKARANGVAMRICGLDRSSVAIAQAQTNANAVSESSAEFHVADVFRDELPGNYDVVMCSLFLHHLDEIPAVELLRRMAGLAGKLVVVDDLRRSRLGYWLAWAGSRVLTRSRVVHNDGPVSVHGAFTVAEALELAERAGLTNASVKTHWPQRYVLTWRRP